METEEEVVHIGIPQLEWEVHEYPEHQRSRRWYIFASVAGVALILYALATVNYLFAVIILMIGVITLLSTFVPPDRVWVTITNTGVVVDDMYYDFEAIKEFSIVYDPPHAKILYLEFHGVMHPLMSVPLEDQDPNTIRELLLPFCAENLERSEENLTDMMRRLYKL
jgi:hypothetical protein